MRPFLWPRKLAGPPTEQEIARARAEIAARYAQFDYAWDIEQRRKPVSKDRRILPIRLRQMERLFRKRWGRRLPNNRDGWNALVDTAHTIAGLGGEVEAHIGAWTTLWAPWLPPARAEQLAAHIAANPIKLGADTLGWRLKLTPEERAELEITTIGAVGQNRVQRAAERKRKAAARARAWRAERSSGKPRGRPRRWPIKIPYAAGNKVIIGEVIAAYAFSPTRGSGRGEVAKRPAKGKPIHGQQRGGKGTRAPQSAKALPKVKTLATGKPDQAQNLITRVPTRAALIRAGFVLTVTASNGLPWLRTANSDAEVVGHG